MLEELAVLLELETLELVATDEEASASDGGGPGGGPIMASAPLTELLVLLEDELEAAFPNEARKDSKSLALTLLVVEELLALDEPATAPGPMP